MRFSKKAQDLPTTAMILLVLGFIALVVLVVIFQSKTGQVSSSLETCRTRGGSCVTVTDQNCFTGQGAQKRFNPYAGTESCQNVCSTSTSKKALLEGTDCELEGRSQVCCVG